MKIRTIAALVILALSVIFATPANAASRKVVVLGDSIVGQMCGGDHQSIPTRIVPGAVDVGCYGWPGSTSGGLWRQTYQPGWIDPANINRPSQSFNIKTAMDNADVFVIGLGTNNALRQESTQWFSWDIDNFMRAANGRQVIWFDIGLRFGKGSLVSPAQMASTVALNTILWNKTKQYANLRAVPWGGNVGAHAEYLLNDGIHLTTAGYYRRWELVNG